MAIKDYNAQTDSFNTDIKKYIDNSDGAFTQGAAVANLGASTNITAVPGSFADLAAVQSYLAGANMVPNIEARLDALEAKVNALLTSIRAGGFIAP